MQVLLAGFILLIGCEYEYCTKVIQNDLFTSDTRLVE